MTSRLEKEERMVGLAEIIDDLERKLGYFLNETGNSYTDWGRCHETHLQVKL